MAGDPAYEVLTVASLIKVLNQGDDDTEATRLYQDITRRLRALESEHGGKHKAHLVLDIEFVCDAKGIDVVLTSKAKLPGRPANRERYFLSERGVLTMQDPGRYTLFPGSDMGRRGGKPDASAD